MTIRAAEPRDLAAVANLHASRITEGFLPTLGEPFLRRLYRRVIASPDAFVLVADTGGDVVGFASGAADLGALYRRFVIRDGVVAGLRAAPRVLRSARRVLETLRYPATAGDAPEAEILAVAVAERATGRGLGHRLVDDALHRFDAFGVHAVKVVAGADNPAALALYRGCGFADHARIAVHSGVDSEVLVWRSS